MRALPDQGRPPGTPRPASARVTCSLRPTRHSEARVKRPIRPTTASAKTQQRSREWRASITSPTPTTPKSIDYGPMRERRCEREHRDARKSHLAVAFSVGRFKNIGPANDPAIAASPAALSACSSRMRARQARRRPSARVNRWAPEQAPAPGRRPTGRAVPARDCAPTCPINLYA